MRKLIGPHLGGSWINNLEILRKWQPPFILVLQPEVDKVRQLREACPGAIIVGRFFHDDSHYASGINTWPKEFARKIHQEIISNPVTPLLDYVQSNNETNQDWEGIRRLNEHTFEWMNLADISEAYKCAILSFSVGNPDLPHKPGDPAGFDGRMLYWQQVLESLRYAQKNNHILLMHAYGYPDMFHPDANWYIYRYERQVQVNLRMLGIANLKYAYGEIGIDRLIVNGKGGYKVVPTTDEGYVNQHLQWERDLQGEDLLLGGAIFTAGDSGGWDTYDIFSTNVASMIAAHYVDHAGDYSTPTGGNGGNDEDETVFIPTAGTGGQPVPTPTFQREMEQDAKDYGVKVEPFSPTGLKDGDYVWIAEKVERLHEAEGGGRHHFYFETVDENGQRLTGVPIRVWWPSGEDTVRSEAKPGEPYSANYPFSPGRNAFNATVLDDRESDMVTGAGMGQQFPKGFNTNVHASIVVKWVRRTYRAATVTPPPVTEPQPTPQPAPSVTMPPLVHPVARPDLRRVTQVFGARPEFYSQYKIDGVPLKGHEGIDFGTPVGSTIVAVDAGRVAEVADQGDKGYGRYVKLVHGWGETVYAHLQQHLVVLGDHVPRGGNIGLSGNTGNSSGPHLHFGIRVKPFDRKDGWGGYTNPAPFLAGVTMTPAPTPPSSPISVIAAIRLAAEQAGLDWRFLASFAYAESSFNPAAVSNKGAGGLMQIAADTWAEWAHKVGATDINNPLDNAKVGAAYYKFLLKYYKNDVEKALTAYNFGPGRVDRGDEIPIETIIFVYKIIHGSDLIKAIGL